MISLRRKPYTWAELFRLVRDHQPIDMRWWKMTVVREPLDEATKAWYREVVIVDTALSIQYPGIVEPDRKARFYVLQCPHCLGVHAEACPRVKSREHYENGAIKRIDYFAQGEWDAEPIIWAEDVFG